MKGSSLILLVLLVGLIATPLVYWLTSFFFHRPKRIWWRTSLRVDAYPDAAQGVVNLVDSSPLLELRLSPSGKIYCACGEETDEIPLGQWMQITFGYDYKDGTHFHGIREMSDSVDPTAPYTWE